MAKITSKDIFKLSKRDFENGAVVGDIYDTIKAGEQFQALLNKARKAFANGCTIVELMAILDEKELKESKNVP
jgi:hypothetical protein